MGFGVASRVRGLSDAAFRELFGTEEQCRAALARLRWRDGFVCPSCGHHGHCFPSRRPAYQCNPRKKQTSPTARTVFHSTKLPFTMWFPAIHLIATVKNGISSVKLGRRLGVRQLTAWTMKRKIIAVMAWRERDKPLSGRVEMDDAWLGGVRSGGKRAGTRPARRRRTGAPQCYTSRQPCVCVCPVLESLPWNMFDAEVKRIEHMVGSEIELIAFPRMI